MSRSTTHRSSDVEYNGKNLAEFFGGLVSANATTRFMRFVAPCDGTIKEFLLGVIVSPTNAAAVIRMGTYDDTDSHLDDKNIQNLAIGSYDMLSDALFVNKEVTRGRMYVVELTNADTTGELAVTIVIEPR